MDKPNIICIDDQRQILATLQKDLEYFDEYFTIQTCESASEAEDLLSSLADENEEVALLICDHIMPGKNGIDFMIDIQNDSRFRYTKKILLTGLATHSDAIAAINDANVSHYLEKPWDTTELLSIVKILITQFIFQTGLERDVFLPILDLETLQKMG
ncbi:MAG: response regulator [Calditrichaeota bacterium]|nr:MAG: response regulator [Calditrichota bacterium]